MKSIILKISAIIILLTIHSLASFSDIGSGLADFEGENSGQTISKFLTIPLSARQLALGGLASAPDDHSATALYSSPGASAFFSRYQFAITHQEWIWGLRKEFLGGNFPLLDWGTVGIGAQMFTLGKFENARDIDENPSNPKFIEYMITASYAKQIIHKKLAVGANISYLESRLDQIAGRAFSASMDAVFRLNSIFGAGIYLRNFGTPMKYNSTKENQPFQTGINVRFEPIKQGKKINPRGTDLKISAGILKTIDEPLEIAAGLQFSPLRYFSLRAGYDYFLKVNEGAAGISGGFGIDIKKYGIDAALKFINKDFSPVWSVTVRYHTDEIIPKTAEDYFRVASRYFKKNRYKSSINYGQKALKLNPNMWKAHSLISKSIAAMHRNEGTEIALIYTGNINDQYTSIAANGYRLGGLSRHLSKIKEIRKDFETSITVDAGNFIGSKTSRQKAEFSQIYFNTANYDFTGAGRNEIIFAQNRSGLKNLKFKYLCTDCKAESNIFLADTVIIRKKGYRIALLNISSFNNNKKNIQERALEIQRITQTKNLREAHIRILMVDDNWENIRYYAQNIPLADIIITSSLKQKFESPIKIRNSIILSTGERGKYLGLLALRFDKRFKFKSYVNNLIPITDEIIPDSDLEKLLNSNPASNKKTEDLMLSEELIRKTGQQGVFTFVSDRHKTPGVYLKVIDKMAEFSLTDSTISARKPILSFKNNSIIYLNRLNSSETELRRMSITGVGDGKVNFHGTITETAFSHDHKWLYATVVDTLNLKTDIYRIKPGATESFRIIGWKDGNEREVDFSSDGKNMLFISDRDGKAQVYISDPLGKTPLRLTDADAECWMPRFSPNSTQIAYLTDRGNLKKRKDLWVYNRETGENTRVTRGANIREFIWFDNSGTLLYSGGVNLIDMNTINIFTKTNAKFIIGNREKNYSEKNPRKLTYKEQSFILYTREYTNGKKEIWLCNIDGTGDKQAVLDNGNNWLK